ncbi:hypothetical protein Taro_028977, partial [Colocasia esculenta]|nr:hypothetical protein [Colocasia esculenta]
LRPPVGPFRSRPSCGEVTKRRGPLPRRAAAPPSVGILLLLRQPLPLRPRPPPHAGPPFAPPPRRVTGVGGVMKFLDWYLKIAAVSALCGASMELFMIHTGFYDKVTVLESEKRAWESSPEGQAIKEALNPWRSHDSETKKS